MVFEQKNPNEQVLSLTVSILPRAVNLRACFQCSKNIFDTSYADIDRAQFLRPYIDMYSYYHGDYF